ncbi:PHD finger protein 21B isoform X2 [Sorex araneus]|uniref:PHD finger protein 21B isoform X2 n=1 Tax=Sorex araneus TaxID=42254 RepID=UPI002433CA60|nr:PHD finger protein 21B isoform X2 [Sorex araneus]
MELQSRPEALALELARPQNGDLSKLHERQPRIAALSDKQALGTISAVPGVGLPVSSLQRLAGHGAAVLPQVRPKTLIPDSLPVAPGRERPPKQPPAFPKGTAVGVKNPSPALPTANSTAGHGGQPRALAEPAAVGCPLSGAGVAYAIISSTPSNAGAVAPGSAVAVLRESIKVQPLLISSDSKVIILQPPVQTQPEGPAQPRSPPEEPPQGAPDKQPPGQETPEKSRAGGRSASGGAQPTLPTAASWRQRGSGWRPATSAPRCPSQPEVSGARSHASPRMAAETGRGRDGSQVTGSSCPLGPWCPWGCEGPTLAARPMWLGPVSPLLGCALPSPLHPGQRGPCREHGQAAGLLVGCSRAVPTERGEGGSGETTGPLLAGGREQRRDQPEHFAGSLPAALPVGFSGVLLSELVWASPGQPCRGCRPGTACDVTVTVTAGVTGDPPPPSWGPRGTGPVLPAPPARRH